MEKQAFNTADNYMMIINKSVHDIYEAHPHECNMLMYAGLTLLFAFGTYKEMKAIPRIA